MNGRNVKERVQEQKKGIFPAQILIIKINKTFAVLFLIKILQRKKKNATFKLILIILQNGLAVHKKCAVFKKGKSLVRVAWITSPTIRNVVNKKNRMHHKYAINLIIGTQENGSFTAHMKKKKGQE